MAARADRSKRATGLLESNDGGNALGFLRRGGFEGEDDTFFPSEEILEMLQNDENEYRPACERDNNYGGLRERIEG